MKDMPREIRISDEQTIRLIMEERSPGEKMPANTIARALVELRTLRQAIERLAPITTNA